MGVPIIGRRAITPGEAVQEFMGRRADNNVTNASRDNAIAALVLLVNKLIEMKIADTPEMMAEFKRQMEAAKTPSSSDAEPLATKPEAVPQASTSVAP